MKLYLFLAAFAGLALAGAHANTPAPTSAPPADPTDTVSAPHVPLEGTGFYLDHNKWAALDPAKNKEASVKFIAPAANGRYRVTIHVVGEKYGNSSYEILLAGRSLGTFVAPPSKETLEEGIAFTHFFHGINVGQGEHVEIRARSASNDGQTWSRARWSKIVFSPVEADPGQEKSRLELAAAQKTELFKPVPRQPDGNGTSKLTGELKQWHKVTVDLAGPFAAETDTATNPFTDYRYDVTFTHTSGSPSYTVPGYFAADGNAANTGATAGTVWRAHLSPDKPGKWRYRISFVTGPSVSTSNHGTPLPAFHGKKGEFIVTPTDKTGRDFRAQGRLTYTGGHYLKYAGSGNIFLKAGADAPETLLAYVDFDDTLALKKNVPLKTWAPHAADWRTGDPTWKNGKGKNLIGALNYLAAKGANAFSFLTYNAAGDGDNIWPFVSRDEKFHYDCSKLDQWGIVFDHAQSLGLFLHFKLQENESDDHRAGARKTPKVIMEALDAGATGPERKLYFRELIARYGYLLGLNWNLGEENTQTPEEQCAMADYFVAHDPYHHLLVIHSFPEQQNLVYEALIGNQSKLTGASAQNSWDVAHRQVLHWIKASATAGRPWVVCNDEQGPAHYGVPPDLGYKGYAGKSTQGKEVGYTEHDVRKATLWGTLMAGGAGVEYYFGYQLAENDLLAEDFRSRDKSWEFCRIALDFFHTQKIPLDLMKNADGLVGNLTHDNSAYCLAQSDQLYLVYLPKGGSQGLNLSAAAGKYTLLWFNPRTGGTLQPGGDVIGGAPVTLTAPDANDWLAVVRAVAK